MNSFGQKLLDASEDESLSASKLRILLRRAALRIKRTETDDFLERWADTFEWPSELDEDTETPGR